MTKTHKLGHDFVPMSGSDWDAFGGAEEGTLICYCPDEATVLLLAPDGKVEEVRITDDGQASVLWAPTALIG